MKEKKEKKEKQSDIDWKESLFKSIVYRIITVTLGFITAYIVTGSILIAIGVALLTETVQFLIISSLSLDGLIYVLRSD